MSDDVDAGDIDLQAHEIFRSTYRNKIMLFNLPLELIITNELVE